MNPKKREILDNNWRRVKARAVEFWQEIKKDPLEAWDRCWNKKVVLAGSHVIFSGRYWQYTPKNKSIPLYKMELWIDFYQNPNLPPDTNPTKEGARQDFVRWLDGEVMNAVSSKGRFLRLMVFDDVIPRCWELRKRLNPPPESGGKNKEVVINI